MHKSDYISVQRSTLLVSVFMLDSGTSRVMYSIPMLPISHSSIYDWNLNCPYTHLSTLALTHLYHAPFGYPHSSSLILTHQHYPTHLLTHRQICLTHTHSWQRYLTHQQVQLTHTHSLVRMYHASRYMPHAREYVPHALMRMPHALRYMPHVPMCALQRVTHL